MGLAQDHGKLQHTHTAYSHHIPATAVYTLQRPLRGVRGTKATSPGFFLYETMDIANTHPISSNRAWLSIGGSNGLELGTCTSRADPRDIPSKRVMQV